MDPPRSLRSCALFAVFSVLEAPWHWIPSVEVHKRSWRKGVKLLWCGRCCRQLLLCVCARVVATGECYTPFQRVIQLTNGSETQQTTDTPFSAKEGIIWGELQKSHTQSHTMIHKTHHIRLCLEIKSNWYKIIMNVDVSSEKAWWMGEYCASMGQLSCVEWWWRVCPPCIIAWGLWLHSIQPPQSHWGITYHSGGDVLFLFDCNIDNELWWWVHVILCIILTFIQAVKGESIGKSLIDDKDNQMNLLTNMNIVLRAAKHVRWCHPYLHMFCHYSGDNRKSEQVTWGVRPLWQQTMWVWHK